MLAQRKEPPAKAKYQRRRPEQSVLYKTIQHNLETFLHNTETQAANPLPKHVQQEFYDYLSCGILAHGFLRVRCSDCKHEKLVAFSCKRRGFCPSCGTKRMHQIAEHLTTNIFPKQPIRQWVVTYPIGVRYLMASDRKIKSKVLAITLKAIESHYRKLAKQYGYQYTKAGAVTHIQRYGSALNLNVHFHSLFLDGAYVQKSKDSKPVFLATPYPTNRQVEQVTRKIATRVIRWLARKIDQTENQNTDDQSGYSTMMAASIRYRTGMGSRAGQRVQRYGTFTQGFIDQTELRGERCASLDGFSVHANTRCKAHQRGKLEKLCRYIARPPFAMSRITQSKGKIIYELKRPFADGTSHLIFTAEEFLDLPLYHCREQTWCAITGCLHRMTKCAA